MKMKVLCGVLVVLLLLSFVAIGIIVYEYLQQEEQITAQVNELFERELFLAEEEIRYLEEQIIGMESALSGNANANPQAPVRATEEQYKAIASQFLEAYLTYSSARLDERFTRMQALISGDLLRLLTPASIELEGANIPFSATGFSSHLESYNLYFRMSNHFSRGYILAEVYFVMVDDFGISPIHTLYQITLEEDSSGEIRVTHFMPFTRNAGGF